MATGKNAEISTNKVQIATNKLVNWTGGKLKSVNKAAFYDAVPAHILQWPS